MKELEARKAVERKKLIQTIARYLEPSGIKHKIIQLPVQVSCDVSDTEPAIQLTGQRIETIRLFRVKAANGGDTGEILRFQFGIKLEKELPKDYASFLKTHTKTIKIGKVLGLFGGKIVAVKWTGGKLADILNSDHSISDILLRCSQILGEMDYSIELVSPGEIRISGPWFVNPGTIIQLYSPDRVYEEQSCIFNYQTVEQIAQLIQQTLPALQTAIS